MSDLSDLLAQPGAAIEGEDDFEAVNGLYLDRGWGDGLPIAPPTAEPVEAMLAYATGRSTSRLAPWRRGTARQRRSAASRDKHQKALRHESKALFGDAALEAKVTAVRRAEDLIVAVIGGAGKHSAFIPTFGATQAVTRALKRADGNLAKHVSDFRRS